MVLQVNQSYDPIILNFLRSYVIKVEMFLRIKIIHTLPSLLDEKVIKSFRIILIIIINV